MSVLPQIVPFNFGDEPINVHESVSAMCSVNKGDSPIFVWWTLLNDEEDNEQNLTSNDGIMILKNSPKLSVLNIESVKARHRGNYTCYAKNKAGIFQHSAYLAINGESFKRIFN